MYTNSKRTAVILGCSNTVWDDYRMVLEHRNPQDLVIFAINDICLHFNHQSINHIVSLHSDLVGNFRNIHKIRNSYDATTHGYKNHEGVDMSWYGKINNIGGTSSLFAVEIALALGLRDVVTCGITLDNKPHYYEDNINIDSTVFDFGRSREIIGWTNKFEHELKEYKQCVKATTGVLTTLLGVYNGKSS